MEKEIDAELRPFGAEYLEEVYEVKMPGGEFGGTCVSNTNCGGDNTGSDSNVHGETPNCDNCVET